MRTWTNKILSLSLFIAGLFAVDGFSQTPPDNEQVSTEKELNFALTKKRGIEGDNGIIYLVEKDGQTLAAYEGGKIKWTVNIIKVCGKPAAGKAEIRYLKLIGDKLQVVFGKHFFASVDIRDGKTEYLGAD